MITDIQPETAALIRREREKRGLQQGTVAERLDIPQSRLSQIENGHRPVSIDEFLIIADAIGFNAGPAIERLRVYIRSKK